MATYDNHMTRWTLEVIAFAVTEAVELLKRPSVLAGISGSQDLGTVGVQQDTRSLMSPHPA